MIRNHASPVGAQVLDTSGNAFAGVVLLYVTGADSGGPFGTQTLGTVNSGVCVAEGNGFYSSTITAAESNYDLVACTFVGVGAAPCTVQYPTEGTTVTLPTAAALPGVAVLTPADLITAALKRLRVLQAGEVPSAEDQSDAFQRLNAMLRSWSLQRNTLFQIVRTTWTIVASQTSYTVGTGGQLNIVRPASPSAIDRIGFQDTSLSPVIEYPGNSPLTEDEYANITLKTFTSPYPQGWYYAPTQPYGTLSPFPIPTSATLQGVIYVPTSVTAFSSVTATITLPDGYDLAIQDNLAVLLAPEWGAELAPALVQSAREAKLTIMTRNVRVPELNTTEVSALFGRGGRPSNIFTGA